MAAYKVDDKVSSKGRIKTRQEDRPRWLAFKLANVTDVNGDAITVNPVGMRVSVVCQAKDLDPVGLKPVPDPEPESEPEPSEPPRKPSISAARKRKQG